MSHSFFVKNPINPVSICWIFTNSCNYECPFCYRKNNKDLSYKDAINVIKKIGKAGVKKITFSGGEPLLRFNDILALLELSKQFGLTTALITNGSILTQEKIDMLCPNLDWITLSLDGSSSEIQEKVGRPRAHFELTLNLLELLSLTNIKIKINSLACKKNINDLVNIPQILEKFRISRWRIFQFYNKKDLSILLPDQYSITDDEFSHLESLLLPFRNKYCDISFSSIKTLDSAYFLLAPDATVFCSRNGEDYILGDLKKDDIKDIWTNAKLIDKNAYQKKVSWMF